MSLTEVRLAAPLSTSLPKPKRTMPVPLLIESFPAPPSHIPASPHPPLITDARPSLTTPLTRPGMIQHSSSAESLYYTPASTPGVLPSNAGSPFLNAFNSSAAISRSSSATSSVSHSSDSFPFSIGGSPRPSGSSLLPPFALASSDSESRLSSGSNRMSTASNDRSSVYSNASSTHSPGPPPASPSPGPPPSHALPLIPGRSPISLNGSSRITRTSSGNSNRLNAGYSSSQQRLSVASRISRSSIGEDEETSEFGVSPMSSSPNAWSPSRRDRNSIASRRSSNYSNNSRSSKRLSDIFDQGEGNLDVDSLEPGIDIESVLDMDLNELMAPSKSQDLPLTAPLSLSPKGKKAGSLSGSNNHARNVSLSSISMADLPLLDDDEPGATVRKNLASSRPFHARAASNTLYAADQAYGGIVLDEEDHDQNNSDLDDNLIDPSKTITAQPIQMLSDETATDNAHGRLRQSLSFGKPAEEVDSTCAPRDRPIFDVIEGLPSASTESVANLLSMATSSPRISPARQRAKSTSTSVSVDLSQYPVPAIPETKPSMSDVASRGNGARTPSPDITSIISKTPRPRRKSSGIIGSTSRSRPQSEVSASVSRSSSATRPRSEAHKSASRTRSASSSMNGRPKSDHRESSSRPKANAMPTTPKQKSVKATWDSQRYEYGGRLADDNSGDEDEEDYGVPIDSSLSRPYDDNGRYEGEGEYAMYDDEDLLEMERTLDGSDSDSSLDLHTPLPNLMVRHGLLSPNSKILSAETVGGNGIDGRPGSIMSVASGISTKTGLMRDERDTPKRRVRHRDGKLLRGGIGLTTGLGWSDSEDEDAPSALTRRISTLNLTRGPSLTSPQSRSFSGTQKRPSQPPTSWSAKPSVNPVYTSRAPSASHTKLALNIPHHPRVASSPTPVTKRTSRAESEPHGGIDHSATRMRKPSSSSLRTPSTASTASLMTPVDDISNPGEKEKTLPPLPGGRRYPSTYGLQNPSIQSQSQAAHQPRPLHLAQSSSSIQQKYGDRPAVPVPGLRKPAPSSLPTSQSMSSIRPVSGRTASTPVSPTSPSSPVAKPRTGTGMVYHTSSTRRMRLSSVPVVTGTQIGGRPIAL